MMGLNQKKKLKEVKIKSLAVMTVKPNRIWGRMAIDPNSKVI